MTKNHGMKKKIREYMAEHNLSYLQARREMAAKGLITLPEDKK